ncbi:MAG: nitroreductase family protein [Lactobacillus sp.]|jgi:nitroreductase|nr:nitroreductase family protein [Lactobacillus sp.]
MRYFKFLGILAVMSMFANTVNAETIKLNKPETTGGMPLMEALAQRKAYRDFSNKEIDKQTLSNILWAAYGKNERGTRTIPTARNQLNLKIYAVMKDGVWLYDGEKHALKKIIDKDIRPLLARQEYVMDAPLNLIFTGTDEIYSATHAGSAYQNVALYTASKGMINVVRGMIDKEAIHKELKLAADEKIIVSQAVGWAK